MKYSVLALVVLLSVAFPVSGNSKGAAKEYPLAAGETLVVKNQEQLRTSSQWPYEYGDTCVAMDRSKLWVIQQIDEDVLVLYRTPINESTVSVQCPDGVITTSTVQKLEEMARRRDRSIEENFLNTFIPKKDYRQ